MDKSINGLRNSNMKKIYLADIFRKAADKHLVNADDLESLKWGRWKSLESLKQRQKKSQFSCCAVVYALDDAFKISSSSLINYTKTRRTAEDYNRYPHHYFVLDWMGKFGVKCGSTQNFKNSNSMFDKEAQAFRFMWLEMLALVAEDEGAFIEV